MCTTSACTHPMHHRGGWAGCLNEVVMSIKMKLQGNLFSFGVLFVLCRTFKPDYVGLYWSPPGFLSQNKVWLMRDITFSFDI